MYVYMHVLDVYVCLYVCKYCTIHAYMQDACRYYALCVVVCYVLHFSAVLRFRLSTYVYDHTTTAYAFRRTGTYPAHTAWS